MDRSPERGLKLADPTMNRYYFVLISFVDLLQCQFFLFLLELLLGMVFGSSFNWGADDFPIAQLHNALSTSDGVKLSPSELSSCRLFFHQIFKKRSQISYHDFSKDIENLEHRVLVFIRIYSNDIHEGGCDDMRESKRKT